MLIIATQPKEISKIVSVIHDWWFSLDQLRHYHSLKSVELHFASKREELQVPTSKKLALIINRVTELKVQDLQKVGQYDLNTIRYDHRANEITITGGIPVKISIKVEELNMKLAYIPDQLRARLLDDGGEIVRGPFDGAGASPAGSG